MDFYQAKEYKNSKKLIFKFLSEMKIKNLNKKLNWS
jgi:hypothetical protein